MYRFVLNRSEEYNVNTRGFRLKNNRLIFICPSCGKRSVYPTLDVQRESYECRECGKLTKSVFKHRPVAMKTELGKQIQVTLREISAQGAIFQVLNRKDVKHITIGQEVRLVDSLNPDFLPRTKCIVQSNDGESVGIQKVI